MNQRIRTLSRSWWFRAPVILAALLATVVLGPWMLAGTLLVPAELATGEAVSGASLAAAALGIGGLLGLAGLWPSLLVPDRVSSWSSNARGIVAALLGIGAAAAVGGAVIAAAHDLWPIAAVLAGIAVAGGVVLAGIAVSGSADRATG